MRLAAEQGHKDAQAALGAKYLYDYYDCSVGYNHSEALRWLRLAAEQKDPWAMADLAHAYDVGQPKDSEEVTSLLRLAVEQTYSEPSSQWQAYRVPNLHSTLGFRYLQGRGTEKNAFEAYVWFRLAEQILADCWEELSFVTENLALAKSRLSAEEVLAAQAQVKQWHEKAPPATRRCPEMTAAAAKLENLKSQGQLGDTAAQIELGWMYYRGIGVWEDEDEQLAWWRKAAKQGNTKAMRLLAGESDDAESIRWLRKAIDQGDAEAMAELAYRYSVGSGVPKDVAQAIKWFHKAAENGDAFAMSELAEMYYEGNRVQKDYSEAVKWWRKAAEQGRKGAVWELAKLHNHGPVGLRDYAEAYVWYGCGQLYYFNIDDCEQIAEKLSSEALIAAKQRSAEVWAKIRVNMFKDYYYVPE